MGFGQAQPKAPKNNFLIGGLRGTPNVNTVDVNGVEVKVFAPLFEWSGVGHPFEPVMSEHFFGAVSSACLSSFLGA
jgi:hypothetical protein